MLGTSYEFTVEARNAFGYSDASAVLSILHALAPDQPSAPTTTNSGTEVILTWDEPANNGSPLTSYVV